MIVQLRITNQTCVTIPAYRPNMRVLGTKRETEIRVRDGMSIPRMCTRTTPIQCFPMDLKSLRKIIAGTQAGKVIHGVIRQIRISRGKPVTH